MTRVLYLGEGKKVLFAVLCAGLGYNLEPTCIGRVRQSNKLLRNCRRAGGKNCFSHIVKFLTLRNMGDKKQDIRHS